MSLTTCRASFKLFLNLFIFYEADQKIERGQFHAGE